MSSWIDEIQVDENDTNHLYMQIYHQIENMILNKTLLNNERLPAVRKLADKLKVNTVTVVKAYELLERDQLVHKKIGSGTYVKHNANESLGAVPMDDEWEQARIRQLNQLSERNITVTADTINFASANPSPDLFPVEDFKEALLEVLDRDRGFAFSYQDSRGYGPLRHRMSTLAKTNGIISSPEEIQIISGAQQGIDLVAKGLLQPGDTVLIERPSYGGAMAAFHSRGARVRDIEMEKDGINIDSLERAVKETRPKLIYLMPNFQNPTGISYTHEKMKKIIELSETYDFIILEDDYVNELSFFAEPASAIKSLDVYQRVIYIKSFSKMFMPGLRLGYMIVPVKNYSSLVLAKQASDISTSGLLQRALECYFNQGKWDRNIKRLTKEYYKRFTQMKAIIELKLPEGVKCDIPMGGLNFWLKLPVGMEASRLYSLALDKNILFAPGSLFYLNQPVKERLRVSIAAVNEKQIESGMREMVRLIRHYDSTDSSVPWNRQQQEPIL
ncbi:MAG: PLP-dependent aminotransferase family protein [Tindallia sp. MSAO_Bac2]|nr:MAG: PLP-dependent aminotransferase family protein [Tindallia sp. MSAO_Bac2]